MKNRIEIVMQHNRLSKMRLNVRHSFILAKSVFKFRFVASLFMPFNICFAEITIFGRSFNFYTEDITLVSFVSVCVCALFSF